MEWIEEKRDDLSLAWTAQLTSDIRDKLVVSYDKMDELRYALSHHRVGKQLRPRTWFQNPWTGTRFSFPQPIWPRCGALGWTRLVKAMQERHGLRMDSQGKVAQRSFAATVALQFTHATKLEDCSDRRQTATPSSACSGRTAPASENAR